ncbi:L-2-hydroxyglutarate dehydrogenase, mitochondrial-like [Apostichopus japonicus]|uniref:L-2-hydroxyglutarate dehydrogenase, mitochondrial-like n=1 Tax=Stichopus japonicus TaxID=307972 RepID=UPI003AB6C9C3
MFLSKFRSVTRVFHPWLYSSRHTHNASSSSTTTSGRHVHNKNTSYKPDYDVCIVGGGIVGLATAQELIWRYPTLKFAVIEKEKELASHQSGHNSGVIHAGIYYTPGSLKARLCVEGLHLTYLYCDKFNIPYKKAGKLIVATNAVEAQRLNELYERGLKNNVPDLQLVGPDQIRDIEPHCRGLKAIHSPHTGIVDWGLVARHYGKHFQDYGGDIFTEFNVQNFKLSSDQTGSGSIASKKSVTIVGSKGQSLKCQNVVTCGGLFSDRLAQLSGCNSEPRIVPFRGDYLVLKKEKRHLVKGNIYPVPDPRFPFLGVHFTPRMDGSVWLGPNAVLALKREGYNLFDFSLKDTLDAVSFSGLRKLALKHLVFGMKEFYKGVVTSAQVQQLQRFVPEIKPEDVERGPAGVRAQALDRDGNLVDDFVFDEGAGELADRILHVRNAPSPAATSSLAIAKMIADKIQRKFSLEKL